MPSATASGLDSLQDLTPNVLRAVRAKIAPTGEETNEHDDRSVRGCRSHGRKGVRVAWPDCRLRFGNADELVGRGAIEESIAGFFTTINGISHQIVDQWYVDDTTIIQLEATHTRKDDRQVKLPAVAVWRRGGDRIDDYRIYVDLAPVYA